MDPSLKKTRKSLSIADKIEIIEASKKVGFKQAEMAEKFKVSVSCVSRILQKKEEIVGAYDRGHNSKRKHISHGKMDTLEQQLYQWILKMNNKGFPVNGPIIIAKAEEMSRALPSSSSSSMPIKFSGGWLDKFKKRFNLEFKKFHGEKKSADEEAARDWLENTLPELLNLYEPSNVFNGDETGLFYKGLADRGFVQGGVKPSGGKVAKERLSVLVTCNMDGTEKKKLLVIGRSKKPRGFPRNLSSLPVIYESAGKAWMNSSIFTKFLKGWDRELRLMDRKILFLVDNFSGHPQIQDELTHIRLEFLPANTTSIIQPADAGIIKNLKGFYRSALCNRLIQSVDDDTSAIRAVKSVSVLDAIYLCAEAWKKVTQTTIKNCFDHAFFSLQAEEQPQDQPDLGLHDVPLPHGMELQDFEAEVRRAQVLEDYDEDSDDDQGDEETDRGEDEEGDPEELKITPVECLKALSAVRQYCQSNGIEEVHSSLLHIENECHKAVSERQKQSRISDFFKKSTNF